MFWRRPQRGPTLTIPAGLTGEELLAEIRRVTREAWEDGYGQGWWDNVGNKAWRVTMLLLFALGVGALWTDWLYFVYRGVMWMREVTP